MPPHHWLRFGRTSAEAVGFIADVAEGADIDIVIHQYPAWTKAGYSLKEMLEMVKIPQVKVIKMGTRDMARWLWDYEQLKAARPDLSIITCHDEYLLPTLLEAGDGALIGFAGFAPELMIELVHACLKGDLARAKNQIRVRRLRGPRQRRRALGPGGARRLWAGRPSTSSAVDRPGAVDFRDRSGARGVCHSRAVRAGTPGKAAGDERAL